MARIARQSARFPAPGSDDPRGAVILEGVAYDDNHPAVLARPEMFCSADEWARSRGRVEQATSAPGEVRQVRRG